MRYGSPEVRPGVTVRPNQRLKLTARGGRLRGKGSVLIAAAAGPQLKRDPLDHCARNEDRTFMSQEKLQGKIMNVPGKSLSKEPRKRISRLSSEYSSDPL
jgi:hypothetical protein